MKGRAQTWALGEAAAQPTPQKAPPTALGRNDMALPREAQAATLSSEQLLVVGGFDGSNHLDSTEVLDAPKPALKILCVWWDFSHAPR